MTNRNKFRLLSLLPLALLLVLSVIMVAQNPGAAPTAESAFNRLLESGRPHAGGTNAGAKQLQSPPTRFDLASRNRGWPKRRSQALREPWVQPSRPGYVFGRIDLAADNGPSAMAIAAFQAGGPPSLAIANFSADTVSIILANPDGSYQPAVEYATKVRPTMLQSPTSTVTANSTWQSPTGTRLRFRFFGAMVTRRSRRRTVMPAGSCQAP